jgi:hypothetical protein
MPPYSSLRTFIQALTTGRTNITYVLEQMASDPGCKQRLAGEIAQPGAFSHPISQTLHQELIQSGMTEPEVAHMERWPNEQKESVRTQIDSAWKNGQPLHFSWELHDGDDPATELRRDANQDVRIVFRSPRKGVRITSRINLGEIMVEV